MPRRCTTACVSSIYPAPSLDGICAVMGAIAVAMLMLATPVRADESYVCEDGRIITVRFGELERMARTDACIAAHLARRTRAPGTAAPARSGTATSAPAAAGVDATNPAVAASRAPGDAAIVDVPVPARKPVIAAVTGASAAAPRHAATEVIVHYETPPPAADAVLQKPRVEQIVFRHAPHHYYSSEPLPKGPIDYRRVPIINAAPGTPHIFHHTR